MSPSVMNKTTMVENIEHENEEEETEVTDDDDEGDDTSVFWYFQKCEI